jgi:hypothetical protein
MVVDSQPANGREGSISAFVASIASMSRSQRSLKFGNDHPPVRGYKVVLPAGSRPLITFRAGSPPQQDLSPSMQNAALVLNISISSTRNFRGLVSFLQAGHAIP